MVTTPRFSIREYDYRYHCDGFTVTIVSDVLCHLWMRITTVPPQIHSHPTLLRGLAIHGNPYFCFVAYHDNEQEEAGDTLTHTFIKRPWPICETRYFYFWGEAAGVTSPSTTAFFELHFDIKIHILDTTPSNRAILQNNIVWATAHNAPAGTVLGAYTAPSYTIHAGAELTASYFIMRAFLFFNTSIFGASWQVAGASLKIYPHTVFCTSSVAYPNLCITKGVQNDPVIASNYGAQLPVTTIGGQIDLRDIIVGQYNSIEFNTAGLTFINPGGWTKFCLRAELDVEDQQPPAGSNVCYFRSQQYPPYYPAVLTVCFPP